MTGGDAEHVVGADAPDKPSLTIGGQLLSECFASRCTAPARSSTTSFCAVESALATSNWLSLGSSVVRETTRPHIRRFANAHVAEWHRQTGTRRMNTWPDFRTSLALPSVSSQNWFESLRPPPRFSPSSFAASQLTGSCRACSDRRLRHTRGRLPETLAWRLLKIVLTTNGSTRRRPNSPVTLQTP